jgi:predicted phage terminase large subunit-like protein
MSDIDKLLKVMETDPLSIQREINNRSLYEFVKYFWRIISTEALIDNWHIKEMCDTLQRMATRVGNQEPALFDALFNVPPGTSKTSICSVLFPAWCWTRWYWMKIITASYSKTLALEPAELCRDLLKSDDFHEMYPELGLKTDKDTKSNFRVIKKIYYKKTKRVRVLLGGARFSTSVGGTLTGMHCHIYILDDPLSADESTSIVKRNTALRWISKTLSTRTINKECACGIMVMQRLHPDDPAGYWLKLQKEKGKKLYVVCLPAELGSYTNKVRPKKYIKKYVNGLLDPVRMSYKVLHKLKIDLGQYGYAGQMGQDPAPPEGGMFKVEKLNTVQSLSQAGPISSVVRYWDKAGTEGGGAFTAGVKIAKRKNGGYIILDIKRGQWGTNKREDIIKATTIADGLDCTVWIEQEPGSGGKESAEATIRNLDGYVCKKECPRGDKATRADPFSVQVNNGDVMLLHGIWNSDFIEEARLFPNSTYKDQIDAAGAGYARLVGKRKAGSM